MCFQLKCCHDLYYCSTNVYTVDHDLVHVHPLRATVVTPLPNALRHRPKAKFIPVSRARQLESEVWALCFGSPGENQLDILPQHVIGTPPVFKYHPFHSIDFKEQAYICKQAAQRTAKQILQCGIKLFMDFGFIRSSTEDYKRPNKKTNRVVLSYDGHSAYLLIINSASRYIWCFLANTKDPPLAILHAFMSKYGVGTGLIRTDQGGKLAQSKAFCDTMLQDFGYVVKPTGADSPSQNGGAKIYNNTLAVKVCTLLYGSGLPAKFWSATLLHAIYLHNRLVHSMTNKTPFEGWHGHKFRVTRLKTFRSRRSKLNHHDFTGIFLGYTATNQNIFYLDTSSSVVKSCHHAVFDEAWYLQPSHPPVAQPLYDLGLEADSSFVNLDRPLHPTSIGMIAPITVPWPLSPLDLPLPKKPPLISLFALLPLCLAEQPNTFAAAAA
jgi:hypothetical protein